MATTETGNVTTDYRMNGVSRRKVLQTGALAVGTLGMILPATADEEVIAQTEDVFEQGEAPDGDVRAEDGATIRRSRNSISMQLSMPAPEPGEYDYPPDTDVSNSEEGPPEVFTLWFFQLDPVGAIGISGHVVDGDHGKHLTLSGNVSVQDELPFGDRDKLEPMKEEVHLAVAPHGALDPELLPEALQEPVGDSSIWWMAFFDDPD